MKDGETSRSHPNLCTGNLLYTKEEITSNNYLNRRYTGRHKHVVTESYSKFDFSDPQVPKSEMISKNKTYVASYSISMVGYIIENSIQKFSLDSKKLLTTKASLYSFEPTDAVYKKYTTTDTREHPFYGTPAKEIEANDRENQTDVWSSCIPKVLYTSNSTSSAIPPACWRTMNWLNEFFGSTFKEVNTIHKATDSRDSLGELTSLVLVEGSFCKSISERNLSTHTRGRKIALYLDDTIDVLSIFPAIRPVLAVGNQIWRLHQVVCMLNKM